MHHIRSSYEPIISCALYALTVADSLVACDSLCGVYPCQLTILFLLMLVDNLFCSCTLLHSYKGRVGAQNTSCSLYCSCLCHTDAFSSLLDNMSCFSWYLNLSFGKIMLNATGSYRLKCVFTTTQTILIFYIGKTIHYSS